MACPAELPPEVVPKPARVVEATTPNGACTLRVRAVPLPAALAMALDQHADLLARLAGGGQVRAAWPEKAVGAADVGQEAVAAATAAMGWFAGRDWPWYACGGDFGLQAGCALTSTALLESVPSHTAAVDGTHRFCAIIAGSSPAGV